ncbi:transcriptional regulator, MerR family [Massilia yuzhufengensis]|uniref:Transcriptional regulator, MerR family n=1 Tax=Massilia yuzhufengensis TaxID=1164594 RepID=A0A1I1TVT3_9BURK|nr:transcriptional regulator, MerR family [Massilia yuzhufengensis]
MARLQQIQALRTLGMALADIGAYLDSPAASPMAIVERQLARLDRQIAEAARMREQLLRLRTQLANGEHPELSIWLTTLEQMTMYEQYFSKEELARLPLYQDPAAQAEWQHLVAHAQSLITSGVVPDAPQAKTFAVRWLERLERDSGGNPAFVLQLTAMTSQDPRAQKEFGLSPVLLDYMRTVIAELRFDIYARYLPPETVARMRSHEKAHADHWIELAVKVRACMAADPAARSDEALALARQWFALFTGMVGDAPEVVEQFRRASSTEPMLRLGTGIGDDVIAFLRRAMARLQASPTGRGRAHGQMSSCPNVRPDPEVVVQRGIDSASVSFSSSITT